MGQWLPVVDDTLGGVADNVENVGGWVGGGLADTVTGTASTVGGAAAGASQPVLGGLGDWTLKLAALAAAAGLLALVVL